jgi:outer membrane protein
MPDCTTYNRRFGPFHRFHAFITRSAGNASQRAISSKIVKEFKIQMLGNVKIPALVLSMGLAVSTTALAQGTGTAAGSSAPASTTKVGIVGIQEAIANTNEGKKELDALQKKFVPKQAELKGLSDEIDNLKKQLQAQGDKLSEDERAARVKALESKQKVLQRTYEDAQNEFQQAEQEIVNRLGKKMLDVLSKYGKNNAYTVILDVSNPQSPVLWAGQGTNITKELVDAYNAQSPVAAPAAKPAGSSGAAAASKPSGVVTPAKQP